MKKLILIIALFSASNLFAQAQKDSLLIQQIPTIQQTVEKQKQEIDDLTLKISSQQSIIGKQQSSLEEVTKETTQLNNTIDSLNKLIKTNQINITSIADDLGTKIQETGDKADTKISELGGDVEKNRLYWIIATLGTILLGALIYVFLGKRIKSSQTDVETRIQETKKSLEEESVKLDNKLIEVLETQLKISQNQSSINEDNTSNDEVEHSLALKVADEIVRMQKNISRMDEDTKGLKPLLKGIERIRNNFAANGYEMINLLNADYDERMNIDVINFNEDENLPQGKKVITKVIKPQVNYNGVMIQRAQVDVSQN